MTILETRELTKYYGTGENQVAVNADGFMEVVGLNVDRLAQTPGKRLILACGSSREEADEK